MATETDLPQRQFDIGDVNFGNGFDLSHLWVFLVRRFSQLGLYLDQGPT